MDANNAVANAMKNIGTLGSWPAPTYSPFVLRTAHVVIGDLTEYFHSDQGKNFMLTYNAIVQDNYWGLGNHDYLNNVLDCKDTPCPLDNAERQGLYCYPPCARGYTSDGATLCYQNCPAGFGSSTAYCEKPGDYGRGGGYSYWDRFNCETNNPVYGCEWYGAFYFPKCLPGYHSSGCCICTADCPAGFADIGVLCKRPVYSRGAGVGVASLTSLFGTNSNICAISAVRSMQNLYKAQTYTGAAGWDDGSASYSWTKVDYRFIMLHNNPYYNTSLRWFGDSRGDFQDMQPSIQWLKRQVSDAKGLRQKVVLLIHDVNESHNLTDSTISSEFQNIVNNGSVVAIFRGHTHVPPHGLDGKNIKGAYVFNCGASFLKTFLLASFALDSITVGVMGASTSGTPFFRAVQKLPLSWSNVDQKWVASSPTCYSGSARMNCPV